MRAAATGISGIIAPDGRYRRASGLDETAIVAGSIGPPVETAFDAIGSTWIATILGVLYVAIAIGARRAT